MKVHQRKTGTLTFGNQKYSYEYWERDWNILGNDDTENLMYTTLHGTLHEMVLCDAKWNVEFPNKQKLSLSSSASGNSFNECVQRLNKMYVLYELARDSGSLEEARSKWYTRLKE